METGKLIVELKGHKKRVSKVVFSGNSYKIATSDYDHTTIIWLTPEGIIEWLKTARIYRLKNEDFEELGLDFMINKNNCDPIANN